MRLSRLVVSAALGSLAYALCAAHAGAAPCAGGGSMTITASSDSLTIAPTAATTFNFGEHVILTATPSGFTISNPSWAIDGPTIKDYNEDLGTQMSGPPAAAVPWSTTALQAADLAQPSVSFYFVPSAAQFEPNNGPFARNVTLTVTKSIGGTCMVTQPLNVVRNESDINRQAEDFYTSNHRAVTSTNPIFGHVVDEHIFWHANIDGNQAANPAWMGFLAWHGTFIRRFDLWRQEFGYNAVAPWYPGFALPTGPQFDAAAVLRQAYNPDTNRVPTYYTITGGSGADFGGQKKIADYVTLGAFTGSFEGGFHGQVHCAIGTSPIGSAFFETSGPGYGSMCLASSPKDPMFWRWHGYIDTLYRNLCKFHPAACPSPSPADPAADPWIADNAMDVANVGTVPSPGTHWISPDVWNRRTRVTTPACVAPLDTYGDNVTSGGVVRNCGSSADHENPEAGVTNYLYGTLRNTRPGAPRVVYAEVGVYYALASTGLTYPTDFTMVPESRQFIALHLEPGTTTSIGPIPWVVPPLPPLNDHYCLYLRVLSVQATPPVEGMGIDTDVANNNDLAWRNIKVVAPGDPSPPSFFIVRNIGKKDDVLTLRFDAPAQLIAAGAIVVTFDEALTRALRAGNARLDGVKGDGKGGFRIMSARAAIAGFRMAPRAQGHVKVALLPTKTPLRGDVTITQTSSRGIDGGVTLRLTNRKYRAPPKRR